MSNIQKHIAKIHDSKLFVGWIMFVVLMMFFSNLSIDFSLNRLESFKIALHYNNSAALETGLHTAIRWGIYITLAIWITSYITDTRMKKDVDLTK